MPLQGYFGNETDPITLGVEPLSGLYPGGVSDRREVTSPAVTPPKADDTERRERLARILLGIATFGGYKPPAFLAEELAMRGKERVAQGKEERKTKRLRASADLIGQAREAEARGDDATASDFYRRALAHAEDPQMAKEITTALGQASGRRRLGTAAREVNETVISNGTRALDRSLRLAIQTKLLGAGMPEPHVQSYLKSLETTWELSKDQSTWIVSKNDGTQPLEIPREVVEKVGNTLIRRKGTEIAGRPGDVRPGVLAEQPEAPTVLPAEHGGVYQRPGVQVAPTGPAPVSPARGLIQTGGGPVSEGPSVGPDIAGLTTLAPPTSRRGSMPTAEQAPFLTTKGVPTNLSWEEIRVKYPNAARVYLDDVEKEKSRQITATALAKEKALSAVPYVQAFPTSAKVAFNKKTRMRDESISINDVVAKKGVLLDVVTARDVSQLNGILASISRLEAVLPKVLAVSPGGNLGNALKIAVQRGLASSEDVATFDAITGPGRIQVAALVNRGRPSEPDAEAVAQAFPRSTDTVKTGLARLRSLRTMMTDSVDGYLGNPTTPLTRKDLDPVKVVPGSPMPGGGTFDRRDFR